MKKVLEEFGKWFLNFALAIGVALILQPIAKGEFHQDTAFFGLLTMLAFLFFAYRLLYLSSKIDGGEK